MRPGLLVGGTVRHFGGVDPASRATSAGNVQAYHADGLGSVRALTDGSGNLIQTYQTDPFGVPTQTQGSSTQPFQFTGQQRDGNGLIYLRARYYDPTTGRFLSRDAESGQAARPISLNRYAYAQDNPTAFTDPSGRCLEDACVLEGAVAYALYGAIGGTLLAGLEAVSNVLRDSYGHAAVRDGTYASASNREIAERIANGHAWDEHRGDFPDVKSPDDLADIIEDILDHGRKKTSPDGRTAYWNRKTDTIVIVNPNDPDNGTAFSPSAGVDYFDRWPNVGPNEGGE